MPRHPRPSALALSVLAVATILWVLRPAPAPRSYTTANNATPALAPIPAPASESSHVPASVPPVASAFYPGPAPAATSAKTFPATAALISWADRYLVASTGDRAALIDEGLALARARRPLLAELIRTDPEAALAAALPRNLRAQLPAEIVAQLEQLVSARAELAVIQSCLHPPGVAHDHSDDFYRSTVIDDREYRVHVYGSRLQDGSLPATSLLGIAIDRDLAVADSRLRVVDSSEFTPAGATAANHNSDSPTVAVEADGKVTVLPSADAVPAFADALIASEQNPTVNEADAGSGSSTVTGRPTQAWTHGDKDLLVIRVDFSDLTGTPINKFDGNAQITPTYIDDVINGSNGVREFLMQSSYGKTDILFDSATDVTGVLRLPNTASSYATAGDSTLLHTHARAAATAAGVNLAAYHRIAVVFTYLGDLASSQITYGGLANVTGANLWVNGAFDLRVVGHELGHTYGLRHSNLWATTDGNPVSLTAGSSLDYGDPFDLMGDGDFFENDFSHWNKSLLQWIPDAAVTVAATSGTYRVYRFDNSAANLAAPRALKIVRDTTRDYWIGYRRGTTSTFADNGAYVLWGYNTATQGTLLDFTAPRTTAAQAADAPLALNTTFNDSAAGISLRPVAQGGSGADEWLDVQVTLQPRIQWAATSYVANEQGGSVVLTATRTANSTGNVSVSYATAPGTAASTADFTFTSGTLNWPDGDMTPKTVTVPLVADALVEGTETFAVTLSSPVGGVVVDPATTTVTIADPGARDPSFAANFINNTVNRVLVLPDGKLLVAGWFSQLQDASFAVYNYGRVARLTSAGAVDTDFNPGSGANGTIYALARQPDGKILIGGDFTSYNGTAINRIARLNTDGSLDSTFLPGTAAGATVQDILVQPDGRILVGGTFSTFADVSRNRLVRLLSDGSIDSSFANPGYSAGGNGIRSLALQTDGKILVAGSLNYSFGSGGGVGFKSGIVRLLANGDRDTSFDVGYGAHTETQNNSLALVNRVVVLSDGRILAGGYFSGFGGVSTPTRRALVRLSSSGAVDASYTPSPNFGSAAPYVETILPLPDGSALIGGLFDQAGGVTVSRFARVLSAGAVDSAFAAAGGHASNVQDLALQPDGKVLLAGAYASFQGASPSRPLWRLVPGLAGLPGTLQLSTDAVAATEGATATLSVTRTGGSLGALAVGYATVAGTATAATDFTTTSGTLTWADGDTAAKTITVPTALDASADTPETFLVNLGAPQLGGALLGDRQQATVTLATAFATWQAGYFTPAELDNSSISGDTADPDGDGLNNLAEFALGLAPRTSDAASAWTTAVQNVGGTDYLTLTFRRRTPALDLAYAVQSSPDLATWSTGPVQVGSAIANGDGTETVTYRDSVSTGAGSRRFLRVLVTRTP